MVLILPIGDGNQTGNFLQFDDAADNACEDESIFCLEDIVWPDGSNDIPVAVNFYQKQSRQPPQPRRFHCLTDQPTADLNLHLGQIFPPRFAQLFQQFLTLWKQTRPCQ